GVVPPLLLLGAISLGGLLYPRYRLFLVVLSVVVGVAVLLFLRKTRAGLVIRAVAQNSEMADCLGADVVRVRTLVFGAACALAGLGGVAAAPMTTAYLGMGIGVIVDAFVVVVIGGLGSMAGAVAVPVGWFSTRATGIYFAMLTLAFAQFLYTVAYKWRDLTGGSDGIAGVPKTALFWGGPSLTSPHAFYFVVATCVVVSLFVCLAVVRSPFGRAVQAIRENERRFTSL